MIHSKEPVSSSCDQCHESLPGVGACKPGVRLYVTPDQKKIKTHGLPQIAVVTTFELMDTQTEAYRWARVEPGIREIVTKPQLQKALDAREQLPH